MAAHSCGSSSQICYGDGHHPTQSKAAFAQYSHGFADLHAVVGDRDIGEQSVDRRESHRYKVTQW